MTTALPTPGASLLIQVLAQPESAGRLRTADWELLVRQARRANLLARLHLELERAGVGDTIPAPARRHLEASRLLARRHADDVRREVVEIRDATRSLGIDVILLKGAAYAVAELPPAEGRLFTDIDILVPRAELERVERALFFGGWIATHHDPYDQRYYRQWMHELPPLRHLKRQTVIDVHHTILPPTARLHPDPAALISAAEPIQGEPGLRVLSPPDLVLHSAAHLFHDGELEQGLRDLTDLAALIRHFQGDDGFWRRLLARGEEMELRRPLYYALHYAGSVLAAPVPAEVLDEARRAAPPPPLREAADWLFRRGLAPPHASCEDWLTPIARWLLYVRSHHLRMPPHLLLPHLARKAWMRHRAAEET